MSGERGLSGRGSDYLENRFLDFYLIHLFSVWVSILSSDWGFKVQSLTKSVSPKSSPSASCRVVMPSLWPSEYLMLMISSPLGFCMAPKFSDTLTLRGECLWTFLSYRQSHDCFNNRLCPKRGCVTLEGRSHKAKRPPSGCPGMLL